MQVVTEIMGEGEDGKGPKCFWLPNQKETELLMCAYMSELNAPLLFHYDMRDQLKRGKRVKQIENITFTPIPTKMKFTDGETFNVTRTARPYLAEKLPKNHITWIPKENCKIEKRKERNYQLICSGKLLGEAELDSLSKNSRYQQTLSGKSF